MKEFNIMIYTLDSWLYVVLPYPTLGREMGNIVLIDDIIKTRVPDIVCGCFESANPLYLNLKEYICYFNDDEVMLFDDDSTVINLFRFSIPELDVNSQKVIGDRYDKKFS